MPEPKRKEEQAAEVVQFQSEMHSGVDVKVENGRITLTAMLSAPVPSSSGKMMIVASTHGFKPTTAIIDGKPVMINFTAAI